MHIVKQSHSPLLKLSQSTVKSSGQISPVRHISSQDLVEISTVDGSVPGGSVEGSISILFTQLEESLGFLKALSELGLKDILLVNWGKGGA